MIAPLRFPHGTSPQENVIESVVVEVTVTSAGAASGSVKWNTLLGVTSSLFQYTYRTIGALIILLEQTACCSFTLNNVHLIAIPMFAVMRPYDIQSP